MAFKSSNIIYFVMGIGGGLVIMFGIGMRQARAASWSTILLVVVWMFISLLVALWHERKKQAELMRWMNQDCRPDLAAQVWQKLLQGRQRKRVRTTLQLNLSTALLNAGWDAEAWQLLQATVIYPPYGNDVGSGFVKDNNLFVCYLRAQDLAGANACLERMAAYLDSGELAKRGRQLVANSFSNVLMTKRYMFQVENGNYEGVTVYFENQFQVVPNLIEKVGCQDVLGRVYDALGETEKAQNAWTFAAQYGGTTVYAARARQRLGWPPQ